MKLRDIIELRDKLKSELVVVEKFLEIAKNRGVNGEVHTASTPQSESARTVSPEQPSLIPGGGRNYGAITGTVREGIQLCADHYTGRDVERALQKLGKPLTIGQISTVLNRWSEAHEIPIVTRGKGSKPTIYGK